MSVLKLPLLVNLQRKVDELVRFINSCSTIILDNALNITTTATTTTTTTATAAAATTTRI
jgi:hypothetical protein